ncbi:MAG: hypothetical protein HFI34_09130 [Lachnospiraceae bacterium]|nr:hypothetical protein [Lachnospiraceae bacterium]
MNKETVSVGIAGMGFYFPKKMADTRAIADELNMTEKAYKHIGVNRIFIPDEEEQSSFMALEASKNAIKDAGINGSDIDMIIVSSFKTDYISWQLSNYLRYKLKADKALTFDVKGACSAYFESIEIAANQIKANTGIETVLVVAGERLFGYGWPTFLSAGGQAVVLQKNAKDFNYLDFEICNYVKCHDMAYVKNGGTAFPFKRGMEWNGTDFVSNVTVKEDMYLNEIKPYVFIKFVQVVKNVLERNGFGLKDVDYMISLVQQDNFDKRILEALGRRDIPTAQEFKKDIGHFSGGDIYVLLEKAKKNNKIKKGDLILFIGIGGVAWFSGLLKF